MNEDVDDNSLHWNMHREPWEERKGVMVVRSRAGSSLQQDMSGEDLPQTMWEALFDLRTIFDPIRTSLICSRGSNFTILQRVVEHIIANYGTAELRGDQKVQRFRDALGIVTANNLQTGMHGLWQSILKDGVW